MSYIACPNADKIYNPYHEGCGLDAVPPEAKSKKAFDAYVQANPDAECVINPAQRFGFPGQPGPVLTAREAAMLGEGITNHPKRSWFGTMGFDKQGNVRCR